MTNLAGGVRSLVLCSLALFGLAACGDDASSSVSRAPASADAGLVAMRGGTIDRTSQPTTGTTTGSTTNVGTGTATVQPPATLPVASTGNATIDWTPPTQNSDGTALTNLAGYTVYYGTSPSSLTQSVKVSNPGLTAYTVTNLPTGTWYFVVTSYSAAGLESSRSGVVSTKI
jgi:hypothetical protein